jgi:hypothetical protein
MIQLSTNSNTQLDWIYSAQPTPIGKHRACYLQALDKERALVNAEFEVRKLAQQVKIKKAELVIQDVSIDKAEAAGDMPAANYLKAQKELVEIEIEELESGIEFIAIQRADAERELNHCRQLMTRACEEAGINFELIDEETYQQLMGENVRLNTGRKLTAQLLESIIGMPSSFIETITELPAADRHTMLSQFTYMRKALEESAKGIGNPILEFNLNKPTRSN